jgi:hypothetical protein
MTLEVGQLLQIDAVDQDPAGEDDSMGQAAATFSGEFPISLKASTIDMTADCGTIGNAIIEDRLKARIATYDQRKALPLTALKADPKLKDCGYPSESLGAMKQLLQDMAAHVGWARKEVKSRVEDFQALEDAWAPLAQEAMKKTHDALPAPGTYGAIVGSQFQLKVESAWCEEKGLPLFGLSVSKCTIDLSLKNTGARTQIEASGISAITFSLADPKGQWHDTSGFAFRGPNLNSQTVVLNTGEELPIRVQLVMDGTIAPEPGSFHLLIAKTKTTASLFRLPSSGKM